MTLFSRMAQVQEDGRPQKFTPEWPPRPVRRQLPNVFNKCTNPEYKKVTWPPQGDDDERDSESPTQTIQLRDEIPLNDEAMRPIGTYKAAPPVYAENPDNLGEVWPPVAPPDTSERVIHDPSRPKRAIRDYSVFFGQNAAPEVQPSYRVPPGTLHVISQRGVLSYNTPDLGGARMAPEKSN